MDKLSHIDGKGKAKMIDISHKKDQVRMARAKGFIRLGKDTIMLIRENEMKKGDVLGLAEIAGIQGAKKTSDLIPLCHPLGLTSVNVSAVLSEQGVEVNAEVKSTGPTGVEMEALTAVQIALLTIYDMCKAVDKKMVIDQVRLIEKTKKDI
jgi:cyclic pyranopterin phosphate synthase